MKKISLLSILTFLSFSCFSQTNKLDMNGMVGIGTNSPQSLLHIKGLDGIDHVQITKSASSPNLDIISAYNGSDDAQSGSFAYGVRPEDDAWQIWERHVGTEWRNLFIVKLNGNVGIGKFDPNYKLDVNGAIRANEVRVETMSWPDYVFAKDYRKMALDEVKKYVYENGHLPDIPSEAVIVRDGLELGEMNKSLMKKVEELTLYLIDHNELLKNQQQTIEAMRLEMDQLKKKIQ